MGLSSFRSWMTANRARPGPRGFVQQGVEKRRLTGTRPANDPDVIRQEPSRDRGGRAATPCEVGRFPDGRGVGRDPMSGVGIGAVDAGVASTVAFYYDIWYSSGMATTRDRENQIFSILGIKRRHGQTAAPDLSVSFVVRSGLPLSSFEAVVSHARVPSGELSAVVAIPPRTLQRRAKRKDPQLDREESDRLARVARLYAFASEVLGSDDAARTWMLTKNRSLDNERPFDLLDTEGDAREVEDALGRIQYGVIA